MTSVEKLVKRLREEGYSIPDGYIFRRTYAGHHQRSAGAWLWYIWTPDGQEFGSCESVKECLEANTLSIGKYGDFIPE